MEVTEQRCLGGHLKDPVLDGTWVSATRKPKQVGVQFSAAEYAALEASCRRRSITAPSSSGSSRYA